MYNRYLPPDAVYEPLPPEEPEAPPRRDKADAPPAPQHRPSPHPGAPGEPLSGVVQQAAQLLGGLFKHFSLENLDTGDILLVLIVLFLFLEKEDNLDLVIALGLMLLLSLGESDAADS